MPNKTIDIKLLEVDGMVVGTSLEQIIVDNLVDLGILDCFCIELLQTGNQKALLFFALGYFIARGPIQRVGKSD